MLSVTDLRHCNNEQGPELKLATNLGSSSTICEDIVGLQSRELRADAGEVKRGHGWGMRDDLGPASVCWNCILGPVTRQS